MRQVLWRNTSIFPKLFFLDARAVFPILIFLFHWANWTFAIAVICIALLIFLEKRGLTANIGLRFLKLYILNGKYRRTRLTASTIRKRCRW